MQGVIHVHLRVHACYGDRGVVPAQCADVGGEGLATVVGAAAVGDGGSGESVGERAVQREDAPR